jgi:hypothetical protein
MTGAGGQRLARGDEGTNTPISVAIDSIPERHGPTRQPDAIGKTSRA